jgi:hypothetical protein
MRITSIFHPLQFQSVQFHENGKRHQENVQKRLKDIQKKTKVEDKEAKKMERDLRKINQVQNPIWELIFALLVTTP